MCKLEAEVLPNCVNSAIISMSVVLILEVNNSNHTGCLSDVCTTVEDAVPVLERQIDDQDAVDTKGTTEHPIQEDKPKRKPNIKKSQGSKGKRSILSNFFFFKEKLFLGPLGGSVG